ncbi:MAG: enoyl-CoA hydratase-related protein [Acidimicrobiia bacterium]
MTYDAIRYEVRDGVAHLTLHRPDDANAINDVMAADLLAAATEIGVDPTVRAVLLSGSGPRFSAGGDVKRFSEMLGGDLPDLMHGMLPSLHRAITMLTRGKAPVICAVTGVAAGAGLGLVCASDLVVSSESTKFVMAYTNIGLTPDGSSSWFLPRIVGVKRALELTLTNRVLTAAEALDLGIVTSVVPDDEVHDAAAALATTIAAGPTLAFATARRLMHTSLEDTLETHLAREADGIIEAARTNDAHEGITAFVEKRPPNFTGT